MDDSRVAVLAVALLMVGGALCSPSVAAAHSGGIAATGSISVTATGDYGYQPDTFQQVPTNATLTVTFTDGSELQHSFTISSREGFVIPSTYTPTQLNQLLTTYPPLYSSFVNVSGDQSKGTFHSPTAPGWYEFVCNVSGHFQNGMYGFIAFGENLPSNLTTPSRVGLGTTPVSPLEVAGIGLVLVFLVIGVAVWLRRRSPPKIPPDPVRHH